MNEYGYTTFWEQAVCVSLGCLVMPLACTHCAHVTRECSASNVMLCDNASNAVQCK